MYYNTEVLLFYGKLIGWDINYQQLGVVNKKKFSLNFSIRKQFQFDYRVARAEFIGFKRSYVLQRFVFLLVCEYFEEKKFGYSATNDVFNFNLLGGEKL